VGRASFGWLFGSPVGQRVAIGLQRFERSFASRGKSRRGYVASHGLTMCPSSSDTMTSCLALYCPQMRIRWLLDL
jgi:hypothetical protein